MPAPKDHTGSRFGRLVAIELTRKGSRWAHRCLCDCGNEVIVTSGRLTAKKKPSRSCGCLRVERVSEATKRRNHKHGHAARKGMSPTYRSWLSMRSRCLNPDDIGSRYYRERGIGICNEWEESFEAFLQDMGERPEGTTLERRDNDKGYCPDNCRWATPYEQARNRRSNRVVDIPGGEVCAADASALTGVNYNTLWARLSRGVTDSTAVQNRRMEDGER